MGAPRKDDGDMGFHDDIAHVILTEDDIQRRVAELGEEISRDYGDESILLIACLRGAASSWPTWRASITRRRDRLHGRVQLRLVHEVVGS
jgi:hypothetical protein